MQDVLGVTLQAHRYRCSTSTVVSIHSVVIYSSSKGKRARGDKKEEKSYPS